MQSIAHHSVDTPVVVGKPDGGFIPPSQRTSNINDFEIVEKIGDGAYSNVYRVRRYEDNQKYAMKKVKLDSLSEKERENAINEVRILASINHPNVIQYKEAFVDEKTKSLW